MAVALASYTYSGDGNSSDEVTIAL